MEILVFAKNHAHPDPDKNRRGCYKRGMPVVVMEDGHTWGIRESKAAWLAAGNAEQDWPSDFVIVKIPGVPALRGRELMGAQVEDDAGTPLVDTNGLPIRFRRRAWSIAIDNVPAGIRNQLIANGEVTVSVAQVRNYIQRIRDNVIFAGLD